MSPALAGPYLASVALLGLAGMAKLARPDGTAGALRAARLPSATAVVRAGSLAEVAVAASAVAAPGPIPATAVAAAYASFLLFVCVAISKSWPISSCGCFGRPDTKPTLVHAVLDGAAASCAAGWALTGPSRLPDAFAHQPWAGVPLAAGAALVAALAYAAFTYPLPAGRPR
ncbi:MAG: MauE/DoxX family redox-associated membrane protein [Acidimicrobiales bacterium]